MKTTSRAPGYYWVRFTDCKNATVGYYSGPTHDDGTAREMPWEVVGSDEIFRDDELVVLAAAEVPALVEMIWPPTR